VASDGCSGDLGGPRLNHGDGRVAIQEKSLVWTGLSGAREVLGETVAVAE